MTMSSFLKSLRVGIGAGLSASLAAVLTTFFAAIPVVRAGENPWREVAKGLHVATFASPRKAAMGDSKITVVRIDPGQYEFRLLCAVEHGKEKRTAKEWCQEFGLVCAINAGMYGKDELTSAAHD